MKKKNFLVITILVIIIGIALVFETYAMEYIRTVYAIKNSDTYNKNEINVKYNGKNYKVTIPKGLGDLNVKGNIHYCLKSQKSVDDFKNEFNELYGKDNVIEKDNSEYIYIDRKEKHLVQVRFNGGIFTDVYIENVVPVD